jgi:hypothetical protein
MYSLTFVSGNEIHMAKGISNSKDFTRKVPRYAARNQESADYVKTKMRTPKISLVHAYLIRFIHGQFQNVKSPLVSL